jgi:hypothetical protein
MKKSLYILLAFAAVTLVVAGCSKKNGGTGAYVPGSCFNGGLNNGGFGGINGFQWRNGQCIQTATGQPVNQASCAGVANGYSGAPNCNFYGGQNPFYGSAYGGGYNPCSVYDRYPGEYTPIRYSLYGMWVCADPVARMTIQSFGTPAFYGNSQTIYRGCVPGSDPRCQSFGGTLGWFHAGVQLGVYIY